MDDGPTSTRRLRGLHALLHSTSWLAIWVFHAIEVVLPLLMGLLHLFLSLPVASQTTSHVRISTWLLRTSAIGYGVVAALHGTALVEMTRRSVRRRDWSFFATRRGEITGGPTRMGTQVMTKRSSRVVWLLKTPLRMWRKLFGLRGLFGLYGKYFDEAFRAREAIEIMLQTYQSYQLSRTVSKPWIHAIAVTMLVLNCFAAPLVATCFARNRGETRRRLAHVLLDMSLDFTNAVVIPTCILYPYVAALDYSLGTVPNNIALNDVWYASAIATVRQVLVISPLDFASSLLPHVTFLGSLSTLKQMLARLEEKRRDTKSSPKSKMLSTTVSVAPLSAQAAKKASGRIMSQYLQRRLSPLRFLLRERVLHSLFIVWGALVLAAHFAAKKLSIAHTPGCRLGLHPWLSKDVPCSVFQVNCYKRGIMGTVNDIDALLRPLDRISLSKLIITHCPKLEIPDIISEFRGLVSIETYNCTLLDWSHTAAITHSNHPALGYVYLMATNMLRFPQALMHDQLPAAFANFRIYRSNLTEVPESLGRLWASRHFFSVAFEHMPLTDLPEMMRTLTIDAFIVSSCNVTSISDTYFKGTKHSSLYLSGNPLTSLPATLGDRKTLRNLVLENTNISALGPWVKSWLGGDDATKRHRLWLYGSPICKNESFLATYPLRAPSACNLFGNTSDSSLVMEFILPQRTLEYDG